MAGAAVRSLETVRADLAARIAWLEPHGPARRAGEIAAAVDAIRSIARRHGLHPTATVASCLAAAVARGERAALRDHLPLMRDALRCERQDGDACGAFAAACTIRLAG